MAFEQAIAMEGDVPARYIALAKAQEKLGSTKKAVEALENAYELDPKVSTLRQIFALYEAAEDTEAATATAARIEEQIAKDNAAKAKRTAVKRTREARAKMMQAGATTRKVVKSSAKKATPKIIKQHVGRKRI